MKSNFVRFTLPLGVFVVGTLVTLAMWQSDRVERVRNLNGYFEYRSRDAVSRVETRLREYEQALIDTRGLFEVMGSVDRASFAAFVAHMNIGVRYPGIQGIGLSVVIPAAGLASHTQAIRREGFLSYEVRPVGPREVYSSIVYLEPFSVRNQRAFGFDMYSEPVRRLAMDRAADTGIVALSDRVQLVQETNEAVQAGFLMYLPVHSRGGGAIAGWVYSPFRAKDFMTGVLGEGASDLDFEVYDGVDAKPEELMYDADPSKAAKSATPWAESTLMFGGHVWTIVTRALPGLELRQGNDNAATVFWLGELVSLLLAATAWLLVGQLRRSQRLNLELEQTVAARTKELHQREERLASILSATNVGTWEWNVQTGEALFNPRWAEIVGYTLEELAPVSIETWSKLAHPADLEESGRLLNQVFARKQDYYEFESRMRHKDGSWVWVFDRGAVATWNDDGQPLMMRGTHTDITQRKRAEDAIHRSEQKFSSLFRILPTGVVLTDHRGQIIEANAAAQAILGLTPSETLSRSYNSPEWKIVRPDGTLMPTQEYASVRALAENRAVVDVEMGVLRPDGEIRWILTSSIPVPLEGFGVSIVFVDITDRKCAETLNTELAARNFQLEKGASLARMAGSIAHHFNNKLQAVTSNLELAAVAQEGQPVSRYVTRAQEAAQLAAEVSRLLLVYLGQSSVHLIPTDLAQSVQQSLVHLPPVETDLAVPGPLVNANSGQIDQLLQALVTNASEALAPTGGRVQVGLSIRQADQIPATNRFPLTWVPEHETYACLEVTDNGSGIAREDIEKLFDPFFSTKFTGRGLGLSVVLGIVQSHRGALTVESLPRLGSVFRVYLPTIEGDQPFATPAAPSGNASRTGQTILFIDDDENIVDATHELLELLGFRVLVATSGVEALQLFQQHREEIDCVITDLTMPKMNGWEVLSALRDLDKAVPIILASGYDQSQVMAETHADNPDAFLSKPFNSAVLSQTLHHVLESARLRDQGS